MNAQSLARYTAPSPYTPEEFDMPFAELREAALDPSCPPAPRAVAAAKLAALDEVVCPECFDTRWGRFGEPTFERDCYGLPIAYNDDGWAPCPTCNADGAAGECDPVVEVPPALLAAVCGLGALAMDALPIAAPEREAVAA